MLGVPGLCVLAMSQRDYLDLVDHTRRRIHPGKRGAITGPQPAALARLGHSAGRWQRQVLAVGSGYFRAIDAADLLIEKAREIGQVWLRGINCARRLEPPTKRNTFPRFRPALGGSVISGGSLGTSPSGEGPTGRLVRQSSGIELPSRQRHTR